MRWTGVPASAGSGVPGSMLLRRQVFNRLKPGLQNTPYSDEFLKVEQAAPTSTADRAAAFCVLRLRSLFFLQLELQAVRAAIVGKLQGQDTPVGVVLRIGMDGGGLMIYRMHPQLQLAR